MKTRGVGQPATSIYNPYNPFIINIYIIQYISNGLYIDVNGSYIKQYIDYKAIIRCIIAINYLNPYNHNPLNRQWSRLFDWHWLQSNGQDELAGLFFVLAKGYLGLIPLSKWVITPVISGLTLLIPFITGVITHLLSGMSHQVHKIVFNVSEEHFALFRDLGERHRFCDYVVGSDQRLSEWGLSKEVEISFHLLCRLA